MREMDIKSCYIGPEISPEQFIAEHMFIYLAEGVMHGYDGSERFTLKPGEYCIVCKNRLARYHKEKRNEKFQKVIILLDEAFLKRYKDKYKAGMIKPQSKEAFLRLHKTALIPNFIHSLSPYYEGSGKIDKIFADIKREELLTILLQSQPELSGVFFDFGIPEKINLEEFMNRNYKFNVSIERFSYLTGRSISAFKRDFKKTFNDTPNRWLMKRRLQEAYFLIERKNKKSTEIYHDLGFEDLSHFSFAFKRQFGIAPTKLLEGKKIKNRGSQDFYNSEEPSR